MSVVILTHFAAFVALLCVALDFGPVWTMFSEVVKTTVSTGRSDSLLSLRLAGPSMSGSPTVGDIGWGLAAGLGGGFGAMLLFHGLGKGSMAVVAPITAAGAAVIPVLFGIATGDTVTILGLIGIVLALVAIVLVSLSGPDDSEPLTVPDEWSAEFRLPAPTGGGAPGPVAASAAPNDDTPTFRPPPPPSTLAGLAAISSIAPPRRATSTLERPVRVRTVSAATVPARIGSGDRRASVATVRQTIVVLVCTAVLSAAAIGMHALRSLLDGGELTGSITATLVFALAIVGLAAYALNNVRSLFAFSRYVLRSPVVVDRSDSVRAAPQVRMHTSSDSASHTASNSPSGTASNTASGSAGLAAQTAGLATHWRAILRQPGVPEALLSGLGFGLFFVFIYRAGADAGQWPLVSARLISVVMFGVFALATTTALLPERGSRVPVVLAGLLDAAAAVFFVLSTRLGLLSIGAVLAALYPVATVVLARIVTKERIRRQQMIGLGLALCAVTLLAA